MLHIYIYSPGHHHDGFMETGALGHASVHLNEY